MTLWVVGMMGTGKTTAGAMAARRREVPFVDTDAEVEKRVGVTLAELWATDGEDRFRAIENAVVTSLGGQRSIVATGGGVVLDPGNREVMRGSGPVVWLRAAPTVIVARLGASPRPLLKGTDDRLERISKLLEERLPLYQALAEHVIDTDDLGPDDVSERIAKLWDG